MRKQGIIFVMFGGILLLGVFVIALLQLYGVDIFSYKSPIVVSEVALGVPQAATFSHVYQYAAPWDKDLYERFYSRIKIIPEFENEIKGGIVPHHILGGEIIATFFDSIKQQEPSTVVIIGPNHFSRGGGDMLSTSREWKTPYGILKSDQQVVNALYHSGLVLRDEDAIAEEHSVYALMSFVKRSLPDTHVVPLILKNNIEKAELDKLVLELVAEVPEDTVFVSSIDFSHYQIPTAAYFHDELSQNVIQTFDYKRLDTLEIDSIPSLYTLMRLMEYYNTQKIVQEYSNTSAGLGYDFATNDTTSYYSPYFSKGEPRQESSVNLLFFGDMMLDRSVKIEIDKNGFDSLLGELAGREGRFFQGVDLIHANLEGPFGDFRRKTSKSIAFNFDPVLIPYLKKYNFSLLTLANNHSYDMGRDAFAETKNNLSEHGIESYGEQYSVNENSLLIKEIAGKKFGFIGINDTNKAVDEEDAIALIHQSEVNADYTIVNIHWGQEYALLSHPRQQLLAHTFVDAGADSIIGHHPHVVQEMEVYNGVPIFYSLGNFVFDQYFSKDTQEGLAVGLAFRNNELSAFIFPLQSMQSRVSHMDFAKAQVLFDRITQKVYAEDRGVEEGKSIFNIKIR